MPIELIRPMLPAAALPVRKMLGSDQNAGRYAFSPAAATMKQAMVRASDPRDHTAAPRPIAPQTIGTTVCHMRSRVRSELQPNANWPTSASVGGSITSQVSVLELEAVPPFEDARQEELDAVVARHHEEVGEREQQHFGLPQRVEQRQPFRRNAMLLAVELRLQRLALVLR